jgi:hypothetical protein
MGNDNYGNGLYDEAKKRVKLKRDFKYHRNSYFLCMIFLYIINMWTSPDYLWVKWPALGWGIGLAFHWLDTVHKLKGQDKFQDEIQREMDILKQRNNNNRIEEQRINNDIFNSSMSKKQRKKDIMEK